MKKFIKKGILQKTIIGILMVLTLNFIVPTYSQADFGGALMSPIVDLVCSIGDAVINLLQICLGGGWSSSGAPDFSFNAFMVEDDEFFASDRTEDFEEQGLIVDKIPSGATSETINVDKKGPNGENLGFDKGWLGMSNKYHVPIATFSPEQIFTGNVPGLDINFINPNKYEDKDGNDVESSASKLQSTIATWYVALRNLTVVGLLSVLVYVGIRIIISSTASDKAKYKQMLMDWLVALCLVFFLHYIMSFVLTMTESICTAIAGDGESNIYVNVISTDNESGIFKTNLLGLARFKTQYADFGQKMAYLIMYIALVIYTVLFTWFYLKRLLMMAFLTLIAPVVALTYPIDKMNDGKAQAFNSWLKEYVFNALIQPFHLIIYTVFVGSAMDLATTNIIYMIAALGFIFTAEKILRKFFGFEKAGAGTLGALAGGLTAGSLLGKLGKGKGGGGSSKASGGKSVPEGEKPPRFEKKHDVSSIEARNSKDDGRLGEPSGESSVAYANAVDGGENPVEKMRREALEERIADGQLSENDLSAEQRHLLGMQDNSNMDTDTNTNVNSDNNSDNKLHRRNWANAHNINAKSALKLGGRAISGAAKFGTRTAFKAGTGTLAAAVTLASGGGFAGASAAFMAGSNVGERLGNTAVNLGTSVGHGVMKGAGATKDGISAAIKAEKGEKLSSAKSAVADRLLAGTALGRELDLAHGDTRYQDLGNKKEIKTNKDNLQYLREQWAAQHGGVMPSTQEVKDKMNSFDPYIEEGLTDIKDMLKAQKAEEYTGSAKQAAIIAAIGKERGITADILNDDKKANAQEANLRQEFMNKGYSQAEAAKQAHHTMQIWKVQNGVANEYQNPPTTQTQTSNTAQQRKKSTGKRKN